MARGQRNLTFKPSDLENILTIEELTQYCVDVIREIRKNASSQYNGLINNIKQLEEFEKDVELFKINGKEDENYLVIMADKLLSLYHQIIEISLAVQKLLPDTLNLADYDKISYAVYVNGERYYLDYEDIKKSGAFRYSESKNALVLNLNKATKNLKTNIVLKQNNTIFNIINKHFDKFSKVLDNTYKGGGKINKGHKAEAFEEHFSIHHASAYNLLKGKEYLTEIVVDHRKALGKELLDSPFNEWGTKAQTLSGERHESITEAWQHIRSAKGTLRGTVSGDIGNVQVKEGQGSSAQVRLTSFANLKTGVEIYSAIINPEEDIYQIGFKLAKYISEPVRKTAAKGLNDSVPIEDLDDELINFFDKYKKYHKLVHIG